MHRDLFSQKDHQDLQEVQWEVQGQTFVEVQVVIVVDSVLGRLLEVAVAIFEDPVVHVPDGEKKLLTQHNIRLKDKEASLFNEQNLFTTLEYLIFVGIH